MSTEAINIFGPQSGQLIPPDRRRTLARILLADTHLTSRLTLKSLLIAAGYEVEGAASLAEALFKLDQGPYQLILADLRSESEDAGPSLLQYARQKDYRPAAALIASDMSELSPVEPKTAEESREIRISNENVSSLLAGVAELIGNRADRRMRRALRAA